MSDRTSLCTQLSLSLGNSFDLLYSEKTTTTTECLGVLQQDEIK